MADQIRATPRSPILGLFSDIVNLPLQYMSAPERTQQMQGAAQFLYGTGIPKTLERASYGESLFSGAGGLGGTTRMRPETAEAVLNVAPFAPVAGRVAGRMIKATEGMPVGMSIKDVSPKIGINVNQGGSSFADKIISGEKKFETRESDSLRSYVGKRVGIIRTGEGKAKAIGDVTLGEPIVVSSPEEFAKLRDLHLVPEGSKFDIKEGGVKYLYPIENPVPYGVEKDVAKYGIVSRKILGEPDTLEKALYPQQAALPTGATGLPSPQSLTMPSVPTVEQMQKYGRTETVPLSKAVSFQSARNWEKFNAKKGAGDLVAGYGDKPLALRLETGEYVIYDGNHRTDLALQKGLTELPMNVIDVKSYDPTHAGRRPVPPSMSDDELLNSLLGNEVKAPQQAALPTQYPLAPAGTRYEEFGGDLTYMTPDEFLQQVRPLQLDAESLDNIAALRSHVESGGKLDPLHIYASGKEDGRHRAYLAKELGIEKVPVALHGQTPTPIESPTFTDPFGNTIGSSIR